MGCSDSKGRRGGGGGGRGASGATNTTGTTGTTGGGSLFGGDSYADADAKAECAGGADVKVRWRQFGAFWKGFQGSLLLFRRVFNYFGAFYKIF